MAREAALGVVALRWVVGRRARRERARCRVVLEHGVAPSAAVGEALAVLDHEVDVVQRSGTVAAGNVSSFFGFQCTLAILEPSGNGLPFPETPDRYVAIITGLARIAAISSPFWPTEPVCQESYPRNSEKARPPGTATLYLSVAETATPAAARTAMVNPASIRVFVCSACLRAGMVARSHASSRKDCRGGNRKGSIGPTYRLHARRPQPIPRSNVGPRGRARNMPVMTDFDRGHRLPSCPSGVHTSASGFLITEGCRGDRARGDAARMAAAATRYEGAMDSRIGRLHARRRTKGNLEETVRTSRENLAG